MDREDRGCRHILQFLGDLRRDDRRSTRSLALYAFLPCGVVLHVGCFGAGHHFSGRSHRGSAVTPRDQAIHAPSLLCPRMSSLSLSGTPKHPDDAADGGYVSFSYFDPLVARRIMLRFSERGVRFNARDASRLDMASAGIGDYDTPVTRYPILARNNRIELLVHPGDQEKARRIVDEV